MPGRVIRYVKDAILRPREELTKRQRQVRFARDLSFYCWRQLRRLRAAGMAAELTYRTIFSLIPVVVLGLVLFRIVGGLEDIQKKVEDQLYSFFGVPEVTYAATPLVESEPETEADSAIEDVRLIERASIELNSPATSTDPADANASAVDAKSDAEGMDVSNLADRQRDVNASIRTSLSDMTDKIAHLDFASIGIVGLLLFVYAAIALADSVEHVFNRIFDAPKVRPVHLRVAIHWSIITLGSGLLAISLYLSGQFIAWLAGSGLGGWGTAQLNRVLAVLASWILLFLLYALMPNTRVSTKAAAIGALVAAILWEAAKFGFQFYVLKALPYSALYGSLGLIPLFLFWIYITWLIVLFGLILTYTLQTAAGRVPRADEDQPRDLPIGDPNWMLPLMVEVARRFKRGDASSWQALATELSLPTRVVHDLCGRLESAGLLQRVAQEESNEAVTLARPADVIRVSDVLRVGDYKVASSDCDAWKYLTMLRDEQRRFADDKTIAELV